MLQNPTSESATKTAELERLRRHELAKLKRGFRRSNFEKTSLCNAPCIKGENLTDRGYRSGI